MLRSRVCRQSSQRRWFERHPQQPSKLYTQSSKRSSALAVLRYLSGYGPDLRNQVQQLIDANKLGSWLEQRYPPADQHLIQSDAALYDYTQRLKQQHMRSSVPVSKVYFDTRMHVIDNALGQHQFVSRVQGSKLKRKNAIKVSAIFKTLPEPLLRMVVLHELAHLREK